MLLLLAGCGDDSDNWSPGPDADVINQVYITTESIETEELRMGATCSYTLSLSRMDDTEALTLPLAVSGDIDVFDVPSTVDFAAGEKDIDITVTFKGSETVGAYSCSIGIAEGSYNSPYTSYTTSVDIEQRVSNWQLYISNLMISDYDGYFFPSAYATELERDGDLNRYRITGFMSNYDLVFELVASKTYAGQYNIYPEGGSEGKDYYNYDAWYFDDEAGQASYPIYHDLLGDNHFDYSYIYIGDDMGGTFINPSLRYGYIYGSFYLYDSNDEYTNTQQYLYLYLSWTANDETEAAKSAWGR